MFHISQLWVCQPSSAKAASAICSRRRYDADVVYFVVKHRGGGGGGVATAAAVSQRRCRGGGVVVVVMLINACISEEWSRGTTRWHWMSCATVVVDNIVFVYVRMIQSGLEPGQTDHMPCPWSGQDGCRRHGASQSVIDHVVIATNCRHTSESARDETHAVVSRPTPVVSSAH